MAPRSYEIRDEQWKQSKDVFLRVKTGRPPMDNQMMFNAILWVAHSRAAGADIPERY